MSSDGAQKGEFDATFKVKKRSMTLIIFCPMRHAAWTIADSTRHLQSSVIWDALLSLIVNTLFSKY
jgi:hypothetical protein